jgi:integrase
VSSCHPRDHLIFSLAMGTGLRLSEIVGLNVGDVFAVAGTPSTRMSGCAQ